MKAKTVRELTRIFATLDPKDLKSLSDVLFKESEERKETSLVSALLDAATFAEKFGKEAPKLMEQLSDTFLLSAETNGLPRSK